MSRRHATKQPPQEPNQPAGGRGGNKGRCFGRNKGPAPCSHHAAQINVNAMHKESTNKFLCKNTDIHEKHVKCSSAIAESVMIPVNHPFPGGGVISFSAFDSSLPPSFPAAAQFV